MYVDLEQRLYKIDRLNRDLKNQYDLVHGELTALKQDVSELNLENLWHSDHHRIYKERCEQLEQEVEQLQHNLGPGAIALQGELDDLTAAFHALRDENDKLFHREKVLANAFSAMITDFSNLSHSEEGLTPKQQEFQSNVIDVILKHLYVAITH